MPTLYKTLLYVPAAAVSSADATAAQLAATPPIAPDFAMPLALVSDPTTVSHYACCPLLSDQSQTYASLPTLKAQIPGSDYQTWRYDLYDYATAVAWLASKGLTIYQPPQGGGGA